jgi:hypothetical protein
MAMIVQNVKSICHWKFFASNRGEQKGGRIQPDRLAFKVFERAAVHVEISPDTKKQFEVVVTPRKLDQAEFAKANPFSIFGRVTDRDGNPLANLDIRAATGIGTLIGGGTAKTDTDGKYVLYFWPGGLSKVSETSPLAVGLQTAQFYVQGDEWKLDNGKEFVFYLMTDNTRDHFAKRLEKKERLWSKTDANDLVFANEPKELNLVLSKTTH